MKEIWKDVPNYEGMYKVSNLGRVKSLERKVKHWKGGSRLIKEKILKQNICTYGYKYIALNKEGKKRSTKVHRIVAIAFLNHKPFGMELVIDHINNVKTDNRVENLQLITNRQNVTKDLKKNSSDYIGVSWSKHANKWVSRTWINGKRTHIGYFNCELAAAKAYNDKLKTISE